MHEANALVLPFAAIGRDDSALVGGKGANLGALAAAEFAVPPGFCVTTHGFDAFLDGGPADERARLLDALAAVGAADVSAARTAGAAIRTALATWPIPSAVAAAVVDAWRSAGSEHAYAVRSSATAEDLPGASFAGQQDTYLNVRGEAALLAAVRRCWISLYTDRAILYRIQNGFDQRAVRLSVVVQRMVEPEVSGILFTADPLTGHRHIAAIDAGWGLGEALVGGTITADNIRVDTRTGQVIDATAGDKRHAIRSLPEGGTVTEAIAPDRAAALALEDAQAVALAALGTRIAAHFGSPQDIEWAIDDAGAIWVLQSRPITTLYPLPAPAPEDNALHAYFSFSHAQVMTDAMPALSRSIWRTLIPFGKADPDALSMILVEAGGRLYVDVTPAMRLPPARHMLPRMLSVADARSAATIGDLVARPEFLARLSDVRPRVTPVGFLRVVGPLAAHALGRMARAVPERAVSDVEAVTEPMVSAFATRLAGAEPGAPRLRAARTEMATLFDRLVMRLFPIIASGMFARLLVRRLTRGRVEASMIDDLLRGLEGNVTTEMDLAVGDLADIAGRSPAVRDALLDKAGDPDAALALLADMDEAAAFRTAWASFLARYGMRGPSEIDIARPRWSEDAASLLAMVAGRLHEDMGELGAHRAHHARMRAEGEASVDLLARAAGGGLLGPVRARIVRRMAWVARGAFAAREHPKFALIRMLMLVKEAAREAGDLLVDDGRIQERDDVFQLEIGEIIDALEGDGEAKPSTSMATSTTSAAAAAPKAATATSDLRALITARKADMARFAQLAPPRVITSDGETPLARVDRGDAPPGALIGSPASAGWVEGRARVVRDPSTDLLAPGEILVAPFTDPGWTPLFLNAAALVMEVGGLMTHGSVVAREYGIPAVVGVDDATTAIRTGQRIRVDGERGWVEIISEEGGAAESGTAESEAVEGGAI